MSESPSTRALPWVLIPVAGLSLYLGYLHFGGPQRHQAGHTQASTVPRSRFTDSAMPAVAALVSAAYRGVPITPEGQARFAEANHGVYVALRSSGRLRSFDWHDGGKVGDALVAATEAARDKLSESDRARIDAVEICVSHSYRSESLTSRSHFLDNTDRGIRGLELTYRGKSQRHSPTEMLARNLSFPRAVTKLQEREQITDRMLAAGAVSARTFGCEQILVQLGPPPHATLMQRGNRLVSIDQVSRDSTVELERLLGDWMIRDVMADGRAIYKWWPSRNEESPANNMIRQWMGTIALVRLGHHRDDPAVFDLAERNIRYNLDHFYHRDQDGLGVIEWNGKAKLGSAALAAIALIEHPNRAAFAAEERALVATTYHLHHHDGSFQTFYKPATRRGQNNYYPGETLLLWSILYTENHDPELLARFMASFRYYRDWHRKHRNPAFIPWHTQADVRMWEQTHDPELAEFVFEMNDWLVGYQEWDAAVYPDTQGRFFDAKRRKFGPPHASSTGVYLEGLIDAYRLADALGDSERRERYRRTIVRGLRSVMQIQFVDDIDMYYVIDRQHVYGGLRTTVYDNAIRIDNVQHNLLGLFRIVDTLPAEAYHP